VLGPNLGKETKMMKNNTIRRLTKIIILLGISISPSLFAQLPNEKNEDNITQKWLNINYAGDDLTGHLLDIYLPTKGEAPYPVIVTVAGSAFFSNNSKQHAFSIGKLLLNHRFAIVATNHRSSREAIFPAHVNDLKGVVRFLRANASKYGLDTTFVGIAGNSSGGNLSALMGTSGGIKNYTVGEKTVSIEGDVGGNTTESSRVDAVADWYGPTAFVKMDSCGSEQIHDAPDSPESVYIGGPIQDNLDLCDLANPITYVDESDPLFLIIHGDADPLVPHCQSVLLYQALKKNGVACEMITVPGAGHGGKWEEEYKEKMVSFFIEAKNKKRGDK
jgi:acetyl esterase/lipase